MTIIDNISGLTVYDADLIEKTAQKRNFLQHLHEKINLPRRASEALSKNYGEQMRLLRDIDDFIRNAAGGMKGSLKLAEHAIKERKYLDVAHFIGNINDDLRLITKERHQLKKALGHDLNDFYGNYEHADLDRDYFQKSAGLMDVFDSKRRKAGRMFEKMYGNTLKERKLAMKSLMSETEYIVEYTFETLKELATYRARGNLGAYVGDLDKLAKKQEVFENKFKQTYETYIKPLIQKIQERREEDKRQQELAKEIEPKQEAQKPAIIPDLPVKQKQEEPRTEGPVQQVVIGPPVEPIVPAKPTKVVPFNPPANQQTNEPEVRPKTPADVLYDTSNRLNWEVKNPAAAPANRTGPTEIPDWAKKEVPNLGKPPGFEKDIETGKTRGRVIPGKMLNEKELNIADELIIGLIKSGNAQEFIKTMLLAYSEDFDDEGNIEASLKCLAAAEAYE